MPSGCLGRGLGLFWSLRNLPTPPPFMILPLAWGAALCPISREALRETSEKPEHLPAGATDAFPLAELEAERPPNRELILLPVSQAKQARSVSSFCPSVPALVAQKGLLCKTCGRGDRWSWSSPGAWPYRHSAPHPVNPQSYTCLQFISLCALPCGSK